ncbi:MAG: hypothetical protein AABX27_04715, partial [Nanoarchaeota archaeon]
RKHFHLLFGVYVWKHLFVEAKLDVTKFEKLLGRAIHIIFEPRIIHLALPLQNNILNGIILYGFVKLDRL